MGDWAGSCGDAQVDNMKTSPGLILWGTVMAGWSSRERQRKYLNGWLRRRRHNQECTGTKCIYCYQEVFERGAF
jgi:hypothetical protein